MSTAQPPKDKKKGVPRLEAFNVNRLPTQVVGVPEELFTKFRIEMVFTSATQSHVTLRRIKDDGTMGSVLPFEEAKRLSKAAGFIRANAKEEARSELTEKTRALFFNAKIAPSAVKDPKLFTKMITGYASNLEKTEASLKRAGDDVEDQQAKGFLKTMVQRAKQALNLIIEDRVSGGKRLESEILLEVGLPQSMRSKTLTGFVEVSPQGKLWTALYGKEMSKFCLLTVREMMTSMGSDPTFYPETPDEFRKLVDEKNLALMCGQEDGDWSKVPEKQKERILEYSFPIVIPARKLEMLRRQQATKVEISYKNVENSNWPMLDMAVNAFVKKHYHQPPRKMADVKKFWDDLAGSTLVEPSLSSKDYRTQAIELLEKGKPEMLPERYYHEGSLPVIVVKKQLLQNAILRVAAVKNPSGASVPVDDLKYENFLPVEIVGPKKTIKPRDRERKQRMRRSKIERGSKVYLKGLRDKGLSSEILLEIEDYLQTFITPEIQVMAARVVYLTSEVSEGYARMVILREEAEEGKDPNDLNDSSSDSEDGDDKDVAILEQPLSENGV